jgi:hypothetical protein
MVAVVVAVLAGTVLLFPALALLFTLTLRGHLGAHGAEAEPLATAVRAASPSCSWDRRSESGWPWRC